MFEFPVLYPINLLNTIYYIYGQSYSVIDVINIHLTSVEYFPKYYNYNKYIDAYSSIASLSIQPRNYWQDRLYSCSIINFNTSLN